MRNLFRWLVGISVGAGLAFAAHAEFPERPITIVAPVPPGGIVDLAARLAAEPLANVLDQSVVVENRTGASGNIAYAHVASAKPDGYTLLASYSMYHVGNPAMFSKLAWAPQDLDPVAMVAVAPHVVVVHPSLDIHSLDDLVAYARENPGKLNYASQGSGSVPHVGTELFKQMTDTDIIHVPYRGSGEAIQDVLSGRVELFITTPPSVLNHIQQGRLRALAVAGNERHPMLTDVSTAKEQGYDFAIDAWVSLFAPAGTPEDVVETLSQALQAGLQDETIHGRAQNAGIAIRYQDPEALAETLEHETRYWTEVIDSAGITVNWIFEQKYGCADSLSYLLDNASKVRSTNANDCWAGDDNGVCPVITTS